MEFVLHGSTNAIRWYLLKWVKSDLSGNDTASIRNDILVCFIDVIATETSTWTRPSEDNHLKSSELMEIRLQAKALATEGQQIFHTQRYVSLRKNES